VTPESQFRFKAFSRINRDCPTPFRLPRASFKGTNTARYVQYPDYNNQFLWLLRGALIFHTPEVEYKVQEMRDKQHAEVEEAFLAIPSTSSSPNSIYHHNTHERLSHHAKRQTKSEMYDRMKCSTLFQCTYNVTLPTPRNYLATHA
jgi:hypothetical protein